jgi:hypothetical protein
MLKRLSVFSCVAFVIAVGATSVSAQKWVDLGTKEVKDRSEQDTWHVGKSKGEFSKIKLFVGDRPVRFYRMTVKFENGKTQEIELKSMIRAGGETRQIDLTGSDRFIDKVDVWYEANTARRGRRSHVTLWGIK